jgi:hypothetical protein
MSDFAYGLPVEDLITDSRDFDFISDSEILSATQLMELSLPVNNAITGQLSVSNQSCYSDISDDDLVVASACADNLTSLTPYLQDENVAPVFATDISDAELIHASQAVETPITEPTNDSGGRLFKNPVSVARLVEIQSEQFAKRTVDKSLWAVTLFGQWRAQRNVSCLSSSELVYIDKPFTIMTDDELAYTVPLFLAEVLKQDGSEYPPTTQRELVLSLQKHLEINGRIVHFLTDEKFRSIRVTLDGKRRSSVI